jgi:ABC-type polysaccharide/polyol phosphate transport system ATPase subunit
VTNAIELRGVGKRYWKLDQQAMLIKSVLPFMRPKRTELWALRGVDLAIESGETVGVLGRNGAGKSTMLRLLAGVSQPTEGSVRVNGRIAPLISVGVGFHQEMSGRENVYVNGMLLGLTAAEVADRFDDIVAFAELQDFIDTPVKFYSSGMFMRLGFAVAIHVEPRVLLVDEVLAVGDIGFQLKCFDRMRRMQESGTSVVIVSHSMHAIRLLCPRAVLIRRGGLEYDGPVEGAIARHHALLSIREEEDLGSVDVEVLERHLFGAEGSDHHAEYDQPMEMAVRLRFRRQVEDPRVFFRVFTESGLLAGVTVTTVGDRWRTFHPGEIADIRIPFRSRLGGGSYQLALEITESDGQRRLGATDGLMMYVAPRLGSVGIVDMCAQILVDGKDRTEHDAMTLNGSPLRPSVREPDR